ncbi:MAG: MmcQ/YjbR family DNA-binding protein [Acidobacteria bacterium]|nr:MmcQ/YjbR family DNA-binding protein [Acidobacteriota bacterium]
MSQPLASPRRPGGACRPFTYPLPVAGAGRKAIKVGTFEEAETALRDAGLAYPETTEDFPWGHRTLKVKGKAFIFMSNEGGAFSLSVKLPESHPVALSMPFAKPTGYGLGKSGWVSATFAKPAEIPLSVLLSWLEESYRAVAPERLAKSLGVVPPPKAR